MGERIVDCKVEISKFFIEANKCADIDCGYSSIMTTMATILAISEAVYRKNNNNYALISDNKFIDYFFEYMNDFSWLILQSNSQINKKVLVKRTINGIRDGLAHQLSLPDGVALVTNRQKLNNLSPNRSIVRVIILKEFISSVEEITNQLIDSCPDAELNIFDRQDETRSIGTQIVKVVGNKTTTSGSAGRKNL